MGRTRSDPLGRSEWRNLRREMCARFLYFFSRKPDRMKIIIECDDTHQQIVMAEALLTNGLVSAIERLRYPSSEVKKSDDEVLTAVVSVVGDFGVRTQWAAVYRVLVDFCGWESDIARFSKRMNRLLGNVCLAHPCTYQAIQKPLANNSILRKNYQEWQQYIVPSGDRVFLRQMIIAKKLLKRLSINA